MNEQNIDNSYWESNGRYQLLYKSLRKLIPPIGWVKMQGIIEALEQEIAKVSEEIKQTGETLHLVASQSEHERTQKYLVYCGGRRDGLLSALKIMMLVGRDRVVDELLSIFAQLKPELESLLEDSEAEFVFLRTFMDGSGSIGARHDWSLMKIEGSFLHPVAWDTPEEGISILQECLREIVANPNDFQFA